MANTLNRRAYLALGTAETQTERERDFISLNAIDEDFRERVQAVVHKREPKFRAR